MKRHNLALHVGVETIAHTFEHDVRSRAHDVTPSSSRAFKHFLFSL
jgi:hypothetical protein